MRRKVRQNAPKSEAGWWNGAVRGGRIEAAGLMAPLSKCHNSRTDPFTFMTSNRPLEDWGKLLGDVPTAGAILDRFLHHAITLAITGRRYRVKDSFPAPSQRKKDSRSNETSTSGRTSTASAAPPPLCLITLNNIR